MKRCPFIKIASGVMGLLAAGTVFELLGQTAGTSLEKSFQSPPADAGLSVVYHWSGGVVTKEGITADLEGMANSGINTVNWFCFDGSGVSDGIQAWPCKSPEWWDLVDHLMGEAKRLKLTIAPHVCSSWGPAGTAGITPELSQQSLVWSELEVEGGRPLTGALPRPQRPAGRGGFGPGMPPPGFGQPGGAGRGTTAAPGPGRGATRGPGAGACSRQPSRSRRTGQPHDGRHERTLVPGVVAQLLSGSGGSGFSDARRLG